MIDDPVTSQAAAAECPTCRAPLAADQRYCVYCGTRAPQARLDFLEPLRAEQASPAAPAAAAAERPGLVSGISALAVVVALGVGALLGHWATQNPPAVPATTSQPATQVIRIEGSGATAAPTATPTAAASATPSPTPTPAASHHTAATPTATPVKNLSKSSIKQAVKNKNPISTGGTPQPKDNKPAGGGSSFTTIG